MRYDILKYNRIRDMRSDSGFSQSHVAKQLSIAQNTLSQYETGERNIHNEVLIKMALLFETSIDYLLGLTDEKRPYQRK
ncbi:MAG: helix-turn-helix domain-containing protein [Defluviitaleaceae bacterium]|nr:helix-turn-helix domain-containing protein [Defluviitaleaceae bacterium]